MAMKINPATPAAGTATNRGGREAGGGLQVGQQLALKVLATGAPGRATAELAGQGLAARTFTVHSERPLQPGQVLQGVVTAAGNPARLRVLPERDTAVEPLLAGLRRVLPQQAALGPTLTAWGQAVQSDSAAPLPTAVAELLKAFLRGLPVSEQAMRGEGLRALLAGSGQFLEAALAARGATQAERLHGDLKARLLKLVDALQSARASTSDQAAVAKLQQDAQSMLARIELQQLQGLLDEQAGQWRCALPLQQDGRVDTLELEVERDGADNGRDRGEQAWHARLQFDLPGLGPLQVRVMVHGNAVSADFFSAQDAARARIADSLAELDADLTHHGLRGRRLQAHTGLLPEAGLHLAAHIVDEQA